jgi:hypothetical protein
MKKTIVKRTLDKAGEVFYALPLDGWAVADAREIMQVFPEGPKREYLMQAAMVANSLCDESGKARYSGYREMLADIEAPIYGEISDAFIHVFHESKQGSEDQVKNSESVPTSSSPTTSV